MRIPSRGARHRIAAAAVAAAVVGGFSIPVAHAADHGDKLRAKQKQAQQHVATVKHDAEGSSAALSRASKELARAQAGLVTARAHLVEVDDQLTAAEQDEAQAQARLDAARTQLSLASAAVGTGQQAVSDGRDAVKRTALSTYTQGDPTLLELNQLMHAVSPSDIVRQLSYGQVVASTETNTYDRLKAAEVLLKVRQRSLADATDVVAAEEKSAATHVAQVEGLQQQAISTETSIVALVARRRAAKAAAATAAHHDQRLLDRAKKREEKLAQQILADAAKHGQKRSVASTSGMFIKPVRDTYITSPYGWRIHPIYHYWGLHDGDDFHAPCGVPEIAVGTGKVVSEYYSDVWGNRLYLDLGTINGDQYTAIYNHISQYKTQVADEVEQGQTVALAGTTGWSTGCHLHFTIMRNGTAIDPMTVLR